MEWVEEFGIQTRDPPDSKGLTNHTHGQQDASHGSTVTPVQEEIRSQPSIFGLLKHWRPDVDVTLNGLLDSVKSRLHHKGRSLVLTSMSRWDDKPIGSHECGKQEEKGKTSHDERRKGGCEWGVKTVIVTNFCFFCVCVCVVFVFTTSYGFENHCGLFFCYERGREKKKGIYNARNESERNKQKKRRI